jgi:hypothetical protein
MTRPALKTGLEDAGRTPLINAIDAPVNEPEAVASGMVSMELRHRSELHRF